MLWGKEEGIKSGIFSGELSDGGVVFVPVSGETPSEKEGRQLEGCRRAELHARFESGGEGLYVSPVGQQASYWSSKPSSLPLRDKEDI
jgi:hypothetical protein